MNPAKFKISSTERSTMSQVKGMTVFNTEEVDTKKQPMFFGKPLVFKDMIILNIINLKT